MKFYFFIVLLSAMVLILVLFNTMVFVIGDSSWIGHTLTASAAPDIHVSHSDRVYTADQFSDTVSVTDPVDNKLLGVIRLGEPIPSNMGPLYHEQLIVHGLGFSPDHRTIVVVSIGSNSVAFIDTMTNAIKNITYVGRSPHEAFFTPNGKEVWVTVRGENYISVLDSLTYKEKTRIIVPTGPGMQIFSPNGKYSYICSSFTPETVVINVIDHKIVGRVNQISPFCPNIAATPDGKQIWFTLKDIGKVMVFDANPPFSVLKTIDTGPITNHVNIAHNANGTFAYVTVGGLNEVQVFRTDNFSKTATIPVGKLPHGVWPSGDGTLVYVGLENEDRLVAIDTVTNEVIGTSPIGQGSQAVIYVPNAMPNNYNTSQGLQPLGIAGNVTLLSLVPIDDDNATNEINELSRIALFDQGLVQVLQAAVTGLDPNHSYTLALSHDPNGRGDLRPLQEFMTNAVGAAIVNTVGPIRQIMQGEDNVPSSYLVIITGSAKHLGTPVQVQAQ